MSKWNQVISPSKPDTVNRAGGEAFTETPEVALVNLVLTSFMKDKFYEATKDEQARLTGLLTQVDPQFAAKAAIYARKKFGMRSIGYVEADLAMKEKALGKMASAGQKTKRFQADDELLRFLTSL